MEWSLTYNPIWVAVVFVVWFVLLNNSRPKLAIMKPTANFYIPHPWLFCVLFVIVCTLGLHRWDTYHMTQYWMYNNFSAHLEPFHIWIIEKITHNSILFYRIAVFGTTSVLYLIVAKCLDDFNNNFCLATCLFILDSMFCEMRGTIGIMVMLTGFILLLNENGKVKSIRTIIAIGIIWLSFYMHRSMPLGIALASIALLRFDRKSLIIGSWIAFPFLIPVAKALLNNALSGVFDFSFAEAMDFERSVMNYGEQGKSVSNINGYIGEIITKLPIYVTFVYLSIRIGFRQLKLDRVHAYLFRIYYIMTYVGALFSFIETSSWIAVRISVMSIYPLPFLLSKVWSMEEPDNKWVKWIIRLAIFACVFNFTYRIYLWSKG